MQIDLPTKQFGEFVLHIEKRKSRFHTFLELDQNVNVTIRAEVIPQSGAKNGEPPNVMPPAKIRNFIFRYNQVLVHHPTGNYFMIGWQPQAAVPWGCLWRLGMAFPRPSPKPTALRLPPFSIYPQV